MWVARATTCVALILTLSAAASAQPEPPPLPDPSMERRGTAEALFDEARQKKDAGDLEGALEKFLASQRLAPAVGTQLNIADCFAALGRTASAWTHFREAASAARAAGDERRAAYAERRAQELAPELCRMRIDVGHSGNVQVSRNDEPLEREAWSTALPVDPGTHRVVARADGFAPFHTEVTVSKPCDIVRVAVPELTPLPREQPVPPPPPPPQRLPPQAIGGWSVLGLGAAGVVVGVALAIRSRVLDDASLAYCPDDPNVCLPEGASLRADARTFEQSAVVALAAGAAAVGVGLAVALTASDGSQTTLRAGPQVGGLWLQLSW